MAYIYKLTFKDGLFYIGNTIQPLSMRISQHKSSVKSGKNSHINIKEFALLKSEILETCEDRMRFEREIYWIAKLRNEQCINKTIGGHGPNGMKHSIEIKEIHRKNAKKRFKDKEFVKKFRKITQNSQEQRKKGLLGAAAKVANFPILDVYDCGKYIGTIQTGKQLSQILGVCLSTACRYINGDIGRKRFSFVRKGG